MAKAERLGFRIDADDTDGQTLDYLTGEKLRLVGRLKTNPVREPLAEPLPLAGAVCDAGRTLLSVDAAAQRLCVRGAASMTPQTCRATLGKSQTQIGGKGAVRLHAPAQRPSRPRAPVPPEKLQMMNKLEWGGLILFAWVPSVR